MSLIGFSKLSCTNCGRRFYSSATAFSEEPSSAGESEIQEQPDKEKDATSFEALIRKIEAAERDSGLKPKRPKRSAKDELTRDSKKGADSENVDGSDGSLISHKHIEKNERQSETASSGIERETDSDSPAIELPLSSLEMASEEDDEHESQDEEAAVSSAYEEKEGPTMAMAESLAVKETPSTELPDPEEAIEEELIRMRKNQREEAGESVPVEGEGEEESTASAGGEKDGDEPSGPVDLEVDFASAKRKKPTPETLNNYDLLSLLPKKRKKG